MNTEKILLVDDERAIRLAVRTALTREGMQVTEAADGSEALELLKKQQFHLVILDVCAAGNARRWRPHAGHDAVGKIR